MWQQIVLYILVSTISTFLGLEIVALSFHVGFAPMEFLVGFIGLMVAVIPTALLEISLAIWVFWKTFYFITEKL